MTGVRNSKEVAVQTEEQISIHPLAACFTMPKEIGIHYLELLFADPTLLAFRDSSGNTPFLLAIKHSSKDPHPILEWMLSEEFAKFLDEKKQNQFFTLPDAQGNAPLAIATQTSWQSLQRLLEDKRFAGQIDKENASGHTLLYDALRNKKYEVALLLLEWGDNSVLNSVINGVLYAAWKTLSAQARQRNFLGLPSRPCNVGNVKNVSFQLPAQRQIVVFIQPPKSAHLLD